MILVTGARGFIGQSLMRALQLKELPAKALGHDVNTPIAINETLADVDTVIHLASAEKRGRARRLEAVDVQGTRRLLAACQKAEVRRFILVSRIGADPDAMYPLLRAKGRQEQLVRRSDLPYTIVRSATVYGRHDHFLNNIVGLAAWSWPLVLMPGGGEMVMQPLWVEDLVRCLLHTLARYDLVERTIEVGGEERMPYKQMVLKALATARLSRLPLGAHPLVLRPISALLFAWWRRPPFNPFFLQRLAVPDITDLDSVLHQFNFRPVHFEQNIAYLRRPGHRRRLIFGERN